VVQTESQPGGSPQRDVCEGISTKSTVIYGPGSAATSAHMDLPFLILNDTEVTGDATPRQRLLVYMSQQRKEVMASCSSWYVDGSFKAAAKTLFTQLLYITLILGLGYYVLFKLAVIFPKDKEHEIYWSFYMYLLYKVLYVIVLVRLFSSGLLCAWTD
jgi:hypothetical protein